MAQRRAIFALLYVLTCEQTPFGCWRTWRRAIVSKRIRWIDRSSCLDGASWTGCPRSLGFAAFPSKMDLVRQTARMLQRVWCKGSVS